MRGLYELKERAESKRDDFVAAEGGNGLANGLSSGVNARRGGGAKH